jgi:hypothetical protein
MGRTWSIHLLVFALACSTCGNGKSGVAAVLPENNEIGTWTLSEAPTVVQTDADLYNRIDGGAPKYITHGWVSSAYAEYQQNDRTVQIGVHDMGTRENAEALFSMYLPDTRSEISYTPESDPEGRRPNAVVNLNLQDTYAAYAFSSRYYIEINIDDKSDAALVNLTAFALETIHRAQ